MSDNPGKTMKQAIIIADSDKTFCSCLKEELERSKPFRVANCFNSGAEVLSFAMKNPIDILIINRSLPDMCGIECGRRLKSGHAQLLLLLIGESFERHEVTKALLAGVGGFLCRSDPLSDYLSAIGELITGGNPLCAEARSLLVDATRAMFGGGLNSLLSVRERDIVSLMIERRHDKEIAEILGISLRTVQTHTLRMFSKLSVHSRSEAINKLIGKGLKTL
jgi:DNA-binding NarL/FixJ family response regulator